MEAFLTALALVTIAEMGDKTQLLAIAFATRFKAREVMTGVFIATIFNHALAVLLGTFLTTKIPISYIQVAASISFIGFGLWTLRGDKLEGEDKRKTRFGPIGTVGIAFFIAELGDKTQLATIAMAAKYQTPVFVLMGTTIGMLIADGLGIWLGVLMGKKIPEKVVKAVSAGIFILFGLFGLYSNVPDTYLNTWNVITFIIVLIGLIYSAIRLSYSSEKLVNKAKDSK